MSTNFIQIAQEWLGDAEVDASTAARKAASLAALLQDTCDDFLLELPEDMYWDRRIDEALGK